MAKQTDTQQDTVARVMHEWKHGELETAAGKPVRDRRQAIAIGLSEAGASANQSPAENRRRERRTRTKERKGGTARQQAEGNGPTNAELYEQARREDVPGRSRMSKAELARVVGG